MALADELVAYIDKNLSQPGTRPIGPDESLIDRGLLDSTAVMILMGFVEERTGVRIPDEEVTPVNFETAQAIESLVFRLRHS
jgi:acyl carrier protein